MLVKLILRVCLLSLNQDMCTLNNQPQHFSANYIVSKIEKKYIQIALTPCERY